MNLAFKDLVTEMKNHQHVEHKYFDYIFMLKILDSMKIEKAFLHITDFLKKNKTEQNDNFKNTIVGLI